MLHRLFTALVIFSLLTLAMGCDSGDGPIAPTRPNEITAHFTHSAPNGYVAGEAVNFDASSSTSPFFKITEFTWDWGDGSDPETFDIPTASHVFPNAGVFTVKLSVTDEAERSESISQPLVIQDISEMIESIVAAYTWDAPSGLMPGQEILFDASSSFDLNGYDLEYFWDFGDNTTFGPSDSPFASHIYAGNGDFTVALTVSNEIGLETIDDHVTFRFGYPSFPPIAGINGYVRADEIATDGEHAYTIEGNRFNVIDLSDPTHPDIIGELTIPDYEFISIWPHGDYVYTSVNNNLAVINVSDPSNPTLGPTVLLPEIPGYLVFHGDNAYVGSNGLTVLDISEPSSPVVIAEHPLIKTERGFGMFDHYLITLEYRNTINVIDMTDVYNPVLSGVTNIDNGFFTWMVGFETYSDYVYILLDASGMGRFHIVDLSDPANPFEAIEPSGFYGADHIALYDDYLVKAGDILEFFSLNDPSQPALTGSVTTRSALIKSMDVIDHYALVIEEWGDLSVVDISMPFSPAVISELSGFSDDYTTGIPYYDLEMKDDFVFETDSFHGLSAVDLTDPMNPILASSVLINRAQTKGFVIKGNLAYIPASYGLHIVDISDPYDLTEIGYAATDQINWVEVANGYAYTTQYYSYNDGLHIFDVSDPAHPQFVRTDPGTSVYTDLLVKGDYLYVGCRRLNGVHGISGVEIFDLSDPIYPLLVSSFQTELGPLDLKLEGNRLYILSADFLDDLNPPNTRIEIFDISNPLDPVRLCGFSAPGHGHDIQVSNEFVYIADFYAKFTIIDARDPYNPSVSGYVLDDTLSHSVAVNGNIAVTYATGLWWVGKPRFYIIKLWE